MYSHQTRQNGDQNRELLRFRQLKSPYGLAWKGDNNKIQHDGQDGYENNETPDHLPGNAPMTIQLVLFVGFEKAPVASGLTQLESQDENERHMGDDNQDHQGLHRAPEKTALGEGSNVQEQDG